MHTHLNMNILLCSVVELKFGSDNYTFSEETATDDSLITIVIANYEKLVINNAIQVLIIPHGTFGANNATNDEGIYYIMIMYTVLVCTALLYPS